MLEALAGKRQANRLAATITNIDRVKEAYETAENSAGSAAKEQENYSKSIQYSLDRAKASLQELSNDILSSKIVKGAVDFFTTVINAIDSVVDHLGAIPVILGTIGSVIAIYFGGKKLFNVQELIGIKSLTTALNENTNAIKINNAEKTNSIIKSGEETAATITETEAERLDTAEDLKQAGAETVEAESEALSASASFAKATSSFSPTLAKLTTSFAASATGAKGLTAVVKGLGGVMEAFPALAALPLIAAFAGIGVVLDKLIVTSKEAKEEYEKLKQEFEASSNELTSLENELSTIESQIESIQSKDSLTLSDEQDLQRLIAERENLELMVEAQKQLNAEKQKDVVGAAITSFQKTSNQLLGNPYQVAMTNYDKYQKKIEEIDKQMVSADAQTRIKLNKQREEYIKKQDSEGIWGNISELLEIKQQMDSLGDQYIEDNRNVYDGLLTTLKNLYTRVDPASWNEMQISSAISSIGITDEELRNLANGSELSADKTKELQEALRKAGLTAEDDAGILSLFLQYLNQYVDKTKEATNATKELSDAPGISDAVDNLEKKLSSQFSQLGDLYTKVFTEDGFTLDNIDLSAMNSLRDSFIELGEDIGFTFDDAEEEVDAFLSVLNNSSSTAEDVQGAFDRLATSYANSALFLNDVNEETAESIKKGLESIGVANAEELVTQALADAKIKEEVATKLATNAKIGEIQELLNEASASETARVAAFQLAAQEKILGSQSLNFSEKISSLKQYASALLSAADAARVNAYVQQVAQQTMYGVSQDQQVAMINKYINSYTPISLKPVEVDFKPASYSGASSGSGGGGGKDKSEEKVNEFSEQIDWIAVKLENLEKQISKFDTIASGTWRTWEERTKALNKEISLTEKAIKTNTKAAKEYKKQADAEQKSFINSKGAYESEDSEGNKITKNLSEDQLKKYNKYINRYKKNGAWDLTKFEGEEGEALYNALQKWKGYWDQALDAEETALKKQDDLAAKYLERFNNTVEKYESKIERISKRADLINTYMDRAELQGHMISDQYYNALAKNEEKQLAQLQKEQAALRKELNSGTIKKGSTDWNNMVNQIHDVSIAIEEAKNQLVEFQNKIREARWQIEEYTQSQISFLTNEAEFLIDLMSNKKLYKYGGQLTNEGTASMGLYAMEYTTLMEQAAYQAEIVKKAYEDVNVDPFDTNAIKHLQEAIDLQQDYIASAEDMKDSIKQMVEEGGNNALLL